MSSPDAVATRPVRSLPGTAENAAGLDECRRSTCIGSSKIGPALAPCRTLNTATSPKADICPSSSSRSRWRRCWRSCCMPVDRHRHPERRGYRARSRQRGPAVCRSPSMPSKSLTVRVLPGRAGRGWSSARGRGGDPVRPHGRAAALTTRRSRPERSWTGARPEAPLGSRSSDPDRGRRSDRWPISSWSRSNGATASPAASSRRLQATWRISR